MTAPDRWARHRQADDELTHQMRGDILGLDATTFGTDAHDPAFISAVSWGLTPPESSTEDPTTAVYPPPGHGFPAVP